MEEDGRRRRRNRGKLTGVLVLVVEDDELVAQGVARALMAEGFAVEVRGDGPGGLAAARSGRFEP